MHSRSVWPERVMKVSPKNESLVISMKMSSIVQKSLNGVQIFTKKYLKALKYFTKDLKIVTEDEILANLITLRLVNSTFGGKSYQMRQIDNFLTNPVISSQGNEKLANLESVYVLSGFVKWGLTHLSLLPTHASQTSWNKLKHRSYLHYSYVNNTVNILFPTSTVFYAVTELL